VNPIVICGIPRSGSTLVWQIFRGVFPDKLVFKIHPESWEFVGCCAVATIRNPYDVAASLYRVRLSRGGENVGNAAGLEIILNRVQMCFGSLSEMMTEPHLLLRYEEFFNHHVTIYNGIKKHFGEQVALHERERIDTKYSLEANRKRALKLKNFNEMDKEGIHGDHIGPVVPGSWREALPKWALLRVSQVCLPIAEEWDYEN